MQIAGENEVKAQIKLRFKTATGQPVVIIRAFQVRYHPLCWSVRFSAELKYYWYDATHTIACSAAADAEKDRLAIQGAGPDSADNKP